MRSALGRVFAERIRKPLTAVATCVKSGLDRRARAAVWSGRGVLAEPPKPAESVRRERSGGGDCLAAVTGKVTRWPAAVAETERPVSGA